MKLTILFALLIQSATANIITVDFAGTWDRDAGPLIHAGDAFSGWAAWDTGDLVGPQIFQSTNHYSFYLSTFDTPGLIIGPSLTYSPVLAYSRGSLYKLSQTADIQFGPSCTASGIAAAHYMAVFTPTEAYVYCNNIYYLDPVAAFATHYQMSLAPDTSTSTLSALVSAEAPEPSTFWLAGMALGAITWKRKPLSEDAKGKIVFSLILACLIFAAYFYLVLCYSTGGTP